MYELGLGTLCFRMVQISSFDHPSTRNVCACFGSAILNLLSFWDVKNYCLKVIDFSALTQQIK